MNRFNGQITILLVDDDAMVRSVLSEYLAAMGFKKVRVSRTSEDALKLIKDPKINIDLIISDWEMPNVSGLTLLKAARNCPHRANVPFIMVTSQRSMERIKIAQAVQWKVDSYLMKPFRLKLFKDKIYDVMGWADKVA